MGRGRQKAKQTKVARQLKYYSPDTDYSALQRELANGHDPYADSHEPLEDTADDIDDELEDDEELDDDDVDDYAHWAAEHGR